MNSEYRTAARILSTSSSPAIVSETTHDLLIRSAPATQAQCQSLLHLAQYVTTLRVRSAREERERERERARTRRNFVDNAAHWAVTGIVGRSGPNVPDKQTVACIEAILVAADNQTKCTGAELILVCGVALALLNESVEEPLLVDRCIALFVQLAHRLCEHSNRNRASGVALLTACSEAVPVLNSLDHLRKYINPLVLADGVVDCVVEMLPAVARTQAYADTEKATRLLCTLISAPATIFDNALQIVQSLHDNALSILLDQEKGSAWNRRDGAVQPFALAILHCAEAVFQRFFLEDASQRVSKESLYHVWITVIDTMAVLHFATLKFGGGGREGSEVFRRASTLGMQFITTRPASDIDTMVKRIFAMQPCLTFMATRPVSYISGARSCLVLFYIDLFEHLVPYASTHTLSQLVVPLASRYVGVEALEVAGPEWFESAHALILAVLELVAHDDTSNEETAGQQDRAAFVLEIVPWYADLVLDLYPDKGISAELLRIAYAAAVRATTTNNWQSKIQMGAMDLGQTLSWTLVCKLLIRLDGLSAYDASAVRRAVESVRRRELLLVLADLLAAVPFELLPKLMPEMRCRLLAERDPANRKAVDDEIQNVVLGKADITRKFALSTWAWQLHADTSKL
ncbi:hypothetical protein EV178_004481 [Coemansia sp. RSA 1646]|nr:hypothetical protein EV178_004481 [Coemansia sp. RSA 1646]